MLFSFAAFDVQDTYKQWQPKMPAPLESKKLEKKNREVQERRWHGRGNHISTGRFQKLTEDRSLKDYDVFQLI